MWNLVKYELLGKRRYYLIFTLALLGFYLSLFFLTLFSHHKIELLAPIFVFSFLAFLISLIISLIINLSHMSREDLNYLSSSIPIKPHLLLYKRLFICFVEAFFLLVFNLLFIIILYMQINTDFSKNFIFYLFKQRGILTISLIPLRLLEFFLILSLFVVSARLPYEDRFIKYSCYFLNGLYIIFANSLETKLAQIFPYKLPFSIPQYNFESMIGKIEASLNTPAIEFNIAVIIYHLLIVVIFTVLISYFLNRKVEIKR